MKANELRIGNYIKRSNHKNWQESCWGDIVEIGYNEMYLISMEKTSAWYIPIEITEEWLLKLGFECISDGGDQKRFALKNRDSNYFYAISLDHEEICLERKDIMGYYTLIWNESYLQYVHQLQNLFFSLRGIELVSF